MRQVRTHYQAGFVIGLAMERGEAHLILNDSRVTEALALAMKDGFPLVMWHDGERFHAYLVEPDGQEVVIDHARERASTFGADDNSPLRALRYALGYWWGGDEEWLALTAGDEAPAATEGDTA